LGVGRFPGRRALIAVGNALTRVPPVVVGVVVVLLIGGETEYGDQATIIPPPDGRGRVFAGPLSGISWIYPHRDVVAQALLALPIMIGLTATAMQRVPAGLLDQAQAFGASGWRCGLLAVRESRRALLAATIVATGITITAVGALYVVQGGYVASCPVVNGGYSAATCDRSDSLAASALLNWQTANGGHGGGLADSGTVAFAYSQVLIGMFFVLAAGLTFLQRNRTSWTPVARS
jgi:ABC-type phosphate transport system permease subunit